MWAARLISKRQQYILDHQLCLDEVEGDEEELRPEFACPYCFEPLDIFSLCSHVADEHCFESRPVVCPVCVTKVGKDIVVHITTHHTNLFKTQRRRRFRKPAAASVQLNQANLQAMLGTSCPPAAVSRSVSGSLPDLLLSTLLNGPVSDTDDPKLGLDSTQAPVASAVTAAAGPRSSCSDCCLTAEEKEQKLEQATLRSHFMQQLVLSTLWC